MSKLPCPYCGITYDLPDPGWREVRCPNPKCLAEFSVDEARYAARINKQEIQCQEKDATIAALRAQLAAWVSLGKRMSAVIADPDNVELWPLTCLWKDIDDMVAKSEAADEAK